MSKKFEITIIEKINETLPIDFQYEHLDEKLIEQELAKTAIGESGEAQN